MRNPVLAAALAAVLVACGTTSEAPEQAQVDAARRKAEAASARLMKELGGRLMAALNEGEPEDALNVCADVAQSISKETAQGEGFHVARTALRVRNPANAPDGYERQVMERWLSADGDPQVVQAVVATDGGHELRWMKPVVVSAPCLTCHGPSEDLPDGVRFALSERYPQDKATGFASGDLRGAITVRIPLR